MTDPRFPRRGGGGTNPKCRDANPLFDNIFAGDDIKMKEIGPIGGGGVPTPLDPPMFLIYLLNASKFNLFQLI